MFAKCQVIWHGFHCDKMASDNNMVTNKFRFRRHLGSPMNSWQHYPGTQFGPV